jgi:hypothetical protein
MTPRDRWAYEHGTPSQAEVTAATKCCYARDNSIYLCSLRRATRGDGTVKINHQVVVFNAADLNAESTFWARLLGGTVDAEDDWHMVLLKGKPRVGVQLARPTTYPRVARGDSAADRPRSVGRRLRASSHRSHVRRREVAPGCSKYGGCRQFQVYAHRQVSAGRDCSASPVKCVQGTG